MNFTNEQKKLIEQIRKEFYKKSWEITRDFSHYGERFIRGEKRALRENTRDKLIASGFNVKEWNEIMKKNIWAEV